MNSHPILPVAIITLAAVAPGMLAGSTTQAYDCWTCHSRSDWILWEADEHARCDGCLDMGKSTVSFPAGSSWESNLQSAGWSWNSIERSRASVAFWSDGDGRYGTNNGENEAVFDNSDGDGGT